MLRTADSAASPAPKPQPSTSRRNILLALLFLIVLAGAVTAIVLVTRRDDLLQDPNTNVISPNIPTGQPDFSFVTVGLGLSAGTSPAEVEQQVIDALLLPSDSFRAVETSTDIDTADTTLMTVYFKYEPQVSAENMQIALNKFTEDITNLDLVHVTSLAFGDFEECPANFFGASCSACQVCGGELVCDDGLQGTGFCMTCLGEGEGRVCSTLSPTAAPTTAAPTTAAPTTMAPTTASPTLSPTPMPTFPDPEGCFPGAFIETDGLVAIEAESAPLIDDTWTLETGFPGYFGEGYVVYRINSTFGGTVKPGNFASYVFRIDTPGRWRLLMRSLSPPPKSEHNDVWLRLPTTGVVAIRDYPEPEMDSIVNITREEFFKMYSGLFDEWSWRSTTIDHRGHQIYFDVPAPGFYELQMSARSTMFGIDRFVLYNIETSSSGKAKNSKLAESPRCPLM